MTCIYFYLDLTETEVLNYSNFDLQTVVTPVKVDRLEELLVLSNFNRKKREHMIDGFRNGFSIGYEGEMLVKRTAPNLKLNVGNETILWNKVMKEVGLGRYAGPHEKPPFEYYIQLPIGLCQKITLLIQD